MGVSSVCQTTVPHTFTQRTRESLVPVPSQPSTGHCPSSQIRQRMGRVPPAFPCPPGAEGVAVALGHLYFCEPTVPPSLVLCMAACLPVLPQQGMGGCPALYPAGMRNRSPSEIGWWGPGAGVCVCWGQGAGQGRGGLQESSPTPQFKSINSSALSLLHSPTLTAIHDHRKNHSLD